MDVVRHDDEGVEFVEAFGAVVLQGFDEECGVGVDLEESAAVVSDRGDEEGAGVGGSRRGSHAGSIGGLCCPRLCGRYERGQFSRFGCACTPAFGRVEGPAAQLLWHG